MTEEQAIERIREAILPLCGSDVHSYIEPEPDEIAKAAWNEMKAIAREDAQMPHWPSEPRIIMQADDRTANHVS